MALKELSRRPHAYLAQASHLRFFGMPLSHEAGYEMRDYNFVEITVRTALISVQSRIAHLSHDPYV